LLDLVPQLGVHMGSTYRDVVKFCLQESQDQAEEAGVAGPGVLHSFNKRVVECLELCTAALGGTC
jgi:hypothetical protein